MVPSSAKTVSEEAVKIISLPLKSGAKPKSAELFGAVNVKNVLLEVTEPFVPVTSISRKCIASRILSTSSLCWPSLMSFMPIVAPNPPLAAGVGRYPSSVEPTSPAPKALSNFIVLVLELLSAAPWMSKNSPSVLALVHEEVTIRVTEAATPADPVVVSIALAGIIPFSM